MRMLYFELTFNLHTHPTHSTQIPFGIAQIGKAFRNEITPRNFIFRSREFEQMEIEYFITPDDEAWPKVSLCLCLVYVLVCVGVCLRVFVFYDL